MRDQFVAQAREILSTYKARTTDVLQVGIEMELSVVGNDLRPVAQSVRDEAVTAFADSATGRAGFVTQELGASQIELMTAPVDIRKVRGLSVLEDMVAKEKALSNWLHQRNANLLRIGASPNERIADIQPTVGQTKYEKCPKFHAHHQRRGMDRFIGTTSAIDVANTLIPGITNSIQLNMDCSTIEQAIEMLNRALAISPVATLFGANGGFLDGKDTGFADVRYLAWAISHDVRTWHEVNLGAPLRVGLPNRYYESLDDYLSSILSIPFFMESDKAFALGVGTYWRDVRLKFLDKSDGLQLVLEFRPVSTQPTPADDFSLMMFYVGRVHYSYKSRELLLPFEYVRSNKDIVMRCGRHTPLAFVEGEGIRHLLFEHFAPIEIGKAIAGLSALNVDDECIQFVRERLEQRARTELPIDAFRRLCQAELRKGTQLPVAIDSAIVEAKLLSSLV
jgi:Glutamate-cysteine ligase family 2(GCS2)